MKCPVCKKNELLEEEVNALSRKDNKTEICSECSQKEAFDELTDEIYDRWAYGYNN